MGVFTMCLGLLQPLSALLGPSFKHPSYIRKTMTRQIHKALDVLACISAIVTIALGTFLVTFANILAPIYVGIVGFMLLVILCLWCDRRRFERKQNKGDSSQDHSLPEIEMKPMVVSSLAPRNRNEANGRFNMNEYNWK
ncbi:hypothetical protein ACA910_001462 [Epithemia clementina (nom. ined.)]